jgi:uncharacterized repeat protein (TIGR01451 family)
VCNIPSNLNGTPLNNSFGVFVDGQQVATSNIVQAVVVEPKLTLTKTANPTSVGPGGTVTYTVTITNTGTATAFDVVFTDTLPAGLTLAGPPTATCASPIIGAGINVTCPQVPVAPAQGSTVTITYQATVSPTAQCNTTLTNSAKVTWTSLPGPKGTVNNPTGSSTVGNSGAIDGERDGSDGLLNSGVLNDYQVQASATITVVCVCDLAIKKTVDPNLPVAGQPFAFTVTVTNVGKGPCAPTTTVTDNLPIGFLVTSFNPNTADGWTCPSGPPGIVCNNPTLTLQPGQNSMVFAVVGTFTVGAGVTNCAELQNQNDTDSSNNKDCVTVMFVQPPKCDLAIKKEVKPSPLVSGQPATVTITVTNVGNAPCPARRP